MIRTFWQKRAVWLTCFALLVLFLAAPAANPLPAQAQPQTPSTPFVLTLFWGDGCSHCHEEMTDFETYRKTYPNLEIRTYELWKHPANVPLLEKVAKELNFQPSAVPVTFLGGKMWTGYASSTAAEIKQQIETCSLNGCEDQIASILSPEEIQMGVPFTNVADMESSQAGFMNSPWRWVVLGLFLLVLILFFYFGLRTPQSNKRKAKQKKTTARKKR